MDKQYIYDYLDNFIANNEPKDEIEESISVRDLSSGRNLYNEIKNSQETSYDIFGSNAMGYTCFALYKSKEQKIYLIIVKLQTPVCYIKVENENIFD